MIRLAIRVKREQAELVLAELLDLAPGGVEEVDSGGELVEYAIYGPPGELPNPPNLTAATRVALVDVYTEEVAEDWPQRWREFHKPLVLEGRLTVRPPWEAPVGDTPLDVVIDPGMAFGTGAHATTQMCLELLLELPERGSFVDVGCGSGVLAIVAARLGFAPVVALDIDPASIEATRANAHRNRVAIDVRRHDVRSDPLPGADTMTANLVSLLLTGISRRQVLPRRLIASGVLEDEADGIASGYGQRGLRESARLVRGEWAALLLERD